MAMHKRYHLLLTKSEVNKLYELLNDHKKSEIPVNIRRQINDLYINANDIVVNGGGA